MASKKNVTYMGTGRRKKSVARVFMTPGTGVITVNGRTLEDYLPQATLRMEVNAPLVLTETKGQFDIKINVYGGGYTGQAGAMRHAIIQKGIRPNKSSILVALCVSVIGVHNPASSSSTCKSCVSFTIDLMVDI